MQNDEKEIRELVATWMAATKAGDVDTMLGLMTDDVVFLVPGHEPFGKAVFTELARSQAAFTAFDGSNDVQEVRVLGDWAFMVTRLTVTATQRGELQPMVRAGHTLSILRKENGKWKIARDANLLAPVD